MIDEVEFYLTDLKSRFDGIDESKYYLSYSGGKDSHFLYWFIKEYLHDNEIEIVSVNTYMEHVQIKERMYKHADKVILPKFKPFEIKEKYGSPCFSKTQDDYIKRYQEGGRTKSLMERINGDNFIGRDGLEHETKFKLNKVAKELLLSERLHKVSPTCCKIIKKDTLRDYEKESGRVAIMGVRGGESARRKARYSKCFSKDGKFTPLYDLSDVLLNEIYLKYNIEVPDIYEHQDVWVALMGQKRKGHKKN